jgi:hypothetical protein
MDLNEFRTKTISEVDNSTIYTAKTPPETLAGDPMEDQESLDNKPSSSSAPWPGSTYIIRSTSSFSSGHVITLLEGHIVLAKQGGRGSIHWDCVEKDGWLGFRNPVSGKFLGHDDSGALRCVVDHHQFWEYFCVRMKPEGGYVLLMRTGGKAEKLWQVGIKLEKGIKKAENQLAKTAEPDGIVWDFSKVQ